MMLPFQQSQPMTMIFPPMMKVLGAEGVFFHPQTLNESRLADITNLFVPKNIFWDPLSQANSLDT